MNEGDIMKEKEHQSEIFSNFHLFLFFLFFFICFIVSSASTDNFLNFACNLIDINETEKNSVVRNFEIVKEICRFFMFPLALFTIIGMVKNKSER